MAIINLVIGCLETGITSLAGIKQILMFMQLGNGSPASIFISALETVAAFYYTYHIVQSLAETSRFREENGAGPDRKMRDLLVLSTSICFLFLVRFLLIALSSIFLGLLSEYVHSGRREDCLSQKIQESYQWGQNTDPSACFENVGQKMGTTVVYYVNASCNLCDFFVLLYLKISLKVAQSNSLFCQCNVQGRAQGGTPPTNVGGPGL